MSDSLLVALCSFPPSSQVAIEVIWSCMLNNIRDNAECTPG